MFARPILAIALILSLFSSLSFADTGSKELNPGKYPTVFFYELHDAIKDLKLPATPVEQRALKMSDEEALSHNIEAFEGLVVVIRKLQRFGNDFGKELIALIDGKTAIKGYKVHQITKLLQAYHLLTTKMLVFSSLYSIEDQNIFITHTNYIQTKKNMLWLASNVILFDVLMDAYKVYYSENARLRRLVKEVKRTNEDVFDQFTDEVKFILTKKNRKHLEKYLRLYHLNKEPLAYAGQSDLELARLNKLIKETPASTRIINDKKYYAKSYGVIDGLISFVDRIMSLLSQYFSDFTKLFTWRDGYLNENLGAQDHLQKRLKPLDILLTKSPFSLTDFFIPGFTTHAAIYMGSEEELRSYGMWDHPEVVPYHKEIRAGKRVIEAVRYGVLYNTFKKFSETDQVIVIRNKNILKNKVDTYEGYERAASLIGKKYDYGFDVEGIDKVVCSEVVYHTHGEITWPTEYIMGRFTISPDNIASLLYYDNSPIELAAYVAGKEDLKSYYEISKEDLGEELGFVKNKSRTKERGIESFDKKTKKCRTVTRRSSLGKRNKRLRTYRVCTTNYEVYDYLDMIK